MAGLFYGGGASGPDAGPVSQSNCFRDKVNQIPVFLSFVISQVVIGLIFTWFYEPNYGVLAPFLSAIGLDGWAVLADEDYATYGIIVAGLYPQIAYCMILYLTGLNNISADQVEAGRLDGAKGWSLFLEYYPAPTSSSHLYCHCCDNYRLSAKL